MFNHLEPLYPPKKTMHQEKSGKQQQQKPYICRAGSFKTVPVKALDQYSDWLILAIIGSLS